jgi:2-hydroxychromene-2-carboxylate isomerase
MDKGTPCELEFWFDFASNYSYLSVIRMRELARAAGVTVLWRPFLLGPIFKSFGWDNSPFVLQKEKGAYVWRDTARQCEKYDIPWQQPSQFPRSSVLASRIAVYATELPWLEDFCRRVMIFNFAADLDINSEEQMVDVLASLGLDAAAIIESAQCAENKHRLRERTEEAKRRGIFGAPTFFVGEDMFWGNDRLDDAIALAARQVAPASGLIEHGKSAAAPPLPAE